MGAWMSTNIKRPHVVVIGGGYGGVSVATAFEHQGWPVTLIERNECFFHKIGGVKAAVVPTYETLMIKPYTNILTKPQSTKLQGSATKIDLETNKVALTLANGEETNVAYDYLVISTGLSHGFGRFPEDKCLSEKDMANFMVSEQEKVKQCDSYVVVGGGALGVELSAQLKCTYPDKDVALYHSREKLLSSCTPPLSQDFDTLLKHKLDNIGVKLHLNTRYKFAHENKNPKVGIFNVAGFHYNIANGSFLPKEHYANDSGEILVDKYLKLRNNSKNNVFAVGDVANIEGIEEFKQARWAHAHANVAIHNIIKLHEASQNAGINENNVNKYLKEYKPYRNDDVNCFVLALFSPLLYFVVQKRVETQAFVGLALGNRPGIYEASGFLYTDGFCKMMLPDDKSASKLGKLLNY